MKSVDAAQFALHLNQYLQDSQSEAIVLTQAGKPCAVVQGVDYDAEQLALMDSKEFWAMIQTRRLQPTIPWEDVKRRLNASNE